MQEALDKLFVDWMNSVVEYPEELNNMKMESRFLLYH